MLNEPNGVLIAVETIDGEIRPASRELFAIGRCLASDSGGSLVAVIIGSDTGEAVNDVTALGADRILVASAPELARFTVDGYARTIDTAIATIRPEIVLLAGTTAGRDIAAFLAGRHRAAHLADCLRIECLDTRIVGIRAVHRGKFLTRVRAPRGRLTFATVRPTAYPVPEPSAGEPVLVESLDTRFALGEIRTTITRQQPAGGGPSSLDTAAVVVVGGRGLGEAGHFHLIEELAAILGGAIGVTGPVTDLGWRPDHERVGQTGRSIAPRLYIGIGVSGAVQHLAGMRGSGTVIAINQDPEAPIFKVADFGIVGDLFEIVPRLIERLRQGQ
ncbi:MAG TPA: electron transfer flavoprotein subunit alpha/FixB family protein [Nitrolancea sp.]|nr:electron transfer flavoprotein subunit alpha/FixB family protein [Nitrolancea sp.]